MLCFLQRVRTDLSGCKLQMYYVELQQRQHRQFAMQLKLNHSLLVAVILGYWESDVGFVASSNGCLQTEIVNLLTAVNKQCPDDVLMKRRVLDCLLATAEGESRQLLLKGFACMVNRPLLIIYQLHFH